MKALVYLRQSLDRDGSGAAIQRQREDCRKLCETRGWTIVAEYIDNDTSASARKPRPAYTRMLTAATAGSGDVIVAHHVDRLTRKLTDLEHLIELSSGTGVKVATVTGDLDLTTDQGRLLGRILASVARGEVERKGARQTRAQQQAAEEGRPPAGRRAFGYNVDGTINRAEARHVRWAYRQVVAGASTRSITTAWNKKGVCTARGGTWDQSVVRRLLLNPRYAALRTYHGKVVGPGKWTALVSIETFDAVNAILTHPDRRTAHSNVRKALLPGLALCPCGAPVRSSRSQRGRRTYECTARREGTADKNAQHISRLADAIDDCVVAAMVGALGDREYIEKMLTAPQDEVDLDAERERVQAARQRLDDLATALSEGVLDLTAVRRESERLRASIAESEARIHDPHRAEVLRPLLNAEDVAKAWRDVLDLDRRRAVIELLASITLLPVGQGKRTFDTASVDIDWNEPYDGDASSPVAI